MAATSFVKTSMNKDPPFADDGEELKSARDDLTIIENALKFVNDLLRNVSARLACSW